MLRDVKRQQHLVSQLQNACLLVIAAWLIVPALYASRDFRFLLVAVATIWIVSEYSNNSVDFLALDWSKLALGLVGAILIVGSYFSDGWQGLRFEISVLVALSLVFAGIQMFKRPYKDFYWTAIAILALFTFVAVTSNETLLKDQWGGRAVVRNSARAAELMLENVGGYMFAYFASALIPILVFLSLKLTCSGAKNFLLRLIAMLVLLIGAVFLFRSGYGIAIVSSVIGGLVVVLPGRLNASSFWWAAVIAVILLFVFHASLFDSAKSMTNGGPLYRKVLALEQMTSFAGIGDEDSRVRVGKYNRSIGSFFNSPIVGTLSPRGIGRHSTLLDTFAQFGLVAGSAMLVALFLPLRQIFRAVRPANQKLVVASGICLFMHAGLNNLQAGTTLAVFVIMPFAISIVQHSSTQSSTVSRRLPRRLQHYRMIGS